MLGCDILGSDNQVAFVLAIFVVHHQHKLVLGYTSSQSFLSFLSFLSRVHMTEASAGDLLQLTEIPDGVLDRVEFIYFLELLDHGVKCRQAVKRQGKRQE